MRTPILCGLILNTALEDVEARMARQQDPALREQEEELKTSLFGLPFWGQEGDQWTAVPCQDGISLLEMVWLIEDQVRRETRRMFHGRVIEERPITRRSRR